jgi:hypothetical protein
MIKEDTVFFDALFLLQVGTSVNSLSAQKSLSILWEFASG